MPTSDGELTDESSDEAKRMLSEACIHIHPNATTIYPKAACDRCLTLWQREIESRALRAAVPVDRDEPPEAASE